MSTYSKRLEICHSPLKHIVEGVEKTSTEKTVTKRIKALRNAIPMKTAFSYSLVRQRKLVMKENRMNLKKEAKLILKEAASSPLGRVRRVLALNGSVEFVVNLKYLIRESLCSDIATCDSALEELVTQGLLDKVKHGPSDQKFRVTKKGYEYAKSLGL